MCGDAGEILTLEELLVALEQSQKTVMTKLQTIPAEDLARDVQSWHRIVVVMKAIELEVVKAVESAGMLGIPIDVLPFPAQGHQRSYVEELAALLQRIE